MSTEKKLTGYPSIDKPWEKFFKQDKLGKIHNDKTVYQDIVSANANHLADLAIMFFGAKITYRELFKQIDATAKSLKEYGVKKGDYVTVCCAGIPEVIYTVYALAKMGAVANLMAPYFDSQQMTDRITDCKSRLLIVMDKFYPHIKDAINKSSIETIIVLPTLNSSILRFLPSKNKPIYDKEILWNRFIKDGNKQSVPDTFEYEKDYPFCLVYSSGTTGASKAIVLTHDSFQYSVLSYDANTIDIARGQKMYQIVPPWYSTGLNTSIHLPLHSGVVIFQDPRFERDVFVKNVIKHKMEFTIAPTSMYEGFLDEQLIKGKKLKGLKYPFEGGEALAKEVKAKIEQNWRRMGNDSVLRVAYGQCECGAQATSQSQNVDHPEGSVGLPIPGVVIGIFDDNYKELKYNERGNILINTPCGMKEYYNNPEATSKYFYYNANGVKWSCTGDIGYISESGDLFVEGRKEDFTAVNSKKIYNFDIENAVRGEKDIKLCDCIENTSENGFKGLALHLIFAGEYADSYRSNQEKFLKRLHELQMTIFEKYNDGDMVPRLFKIRDSFPYKPSGKRDIESLANETTGFIYLEFAKEIQGAKTMPTEKKMTGYPSIDRPQESFYRTKPVRKIEAEQTIYELVFNSNKNNMNVPAIEYMGVTWSFEKLKTEADRAADAFAKSGLKFGDTVLLGVSNCPEAVVTLLALNKLGIVSKWFDVRAGEKDIEDYANDSNCRYIIAFDMLLPKIQMVLDNTKLEKVLVIYPTDSLSAVMQAVYSLKANRLPKDSRYIRYKDFLKSGNPKSNIPCVAFDKNRPSVMIQSSGTTGKPKIIVHSDFSATSCAKKLAYSDLPIEQDKTLLDALPPWIAYALGEAILYPLSLGSKVKLCPTFEPNMVMDNLGTFTIAFAAPFHYRHIRDNFNKLSQKQRDGLKKIDCLVSGGDKISTDENAELEQILGTVLVNGYGNNEGWGCLTVNPSKSNKYGTVGIPKYGETMIAYNSETEKELPYGESGEICSLTDTMFLCYEGNPTETSAVKQLHSDGKVWLHTGDLGFVDEDGFITLNGRARRVIVRQGFKISAYTIEDKITEHPAVKECVAVEVKDKVEEHVPMAYIVLKDGTDDHKTIKQSIYDKCHSELKEYEIPKYFRIVTELPYTQNGKYDFRLLEKQGNEFVELQK